MKSTKREELRICTMADIEIGSCFTSGDHTQVFIKTNRLWAEKSTDYIAVNLENGHLVYLSTSTEVIPVTAEVIVG